MSISAEMILLLISMISNVVIVFSKRIKLIYSPCCYVDCRTNAEEDEDEEMTNDNSTGLLKRLVSKITPRRIKQDKANEFKVSSNDRQNDIV